MALYIVRARPKNDLSGLRKELNSGEISRLRPFGKTLQYGLDNAKIDPNDGYALWIEEDYCNPPLVMERESVLDRYFDITVQLITSEKEGLDRIANIPRLWTKYNETDELKIKSLIKLNRKLLLNGTSFKDR